MLSSYMFLFYYAFNLKVIYEVLLCSLILKIKNNLYRVLINLIYIFCFFTKNHNFMQNI